MIPIVKTPDYNPQKDEMWGHLSSFFNFFEYNEKKDYETLWEGVQQIYDELLRRTYNTSLAFSPRNAFTDGAAKYIQLDFSIYNSMAINIDPSNEKLGYLCTPELVESLPVSVDNDGENVYADRVYSKEIINFRHIFNPSEDLYIVFRKFDGSLHYGIIDSMYIEMDGGEAVNNGNNYITVTGFKAESYEDLKFNFYFTSGKDFRIDGLIKAVDELNSAINVPEAGVVFRKDDDYEFEDSIIRFKSNILKDYDFEFTMYIPNGEMILTELYNNFGAMINIRDWSSYKWSNEDGRGCFMAIIRGYYLAGNPEIIRSALSAVHGISVANRPSKVLGVFESYEYEVTNINGATLTLKEDLNPLFEITGSYKPKICFVKDNSIAIIISSVILSKTITVEGNISSVAIGDKLCIELISGFHFTEVQAESTYDKFAFKLRSAYNSNTEDPPPFIKYLMEYVDKAGVKQDIPGENNNTMNIKLALPRMVVSSSRVNGIYHLYKAPTRTGNTLFISKASCRAEYDNLSRPFPYNDHIDLDIDGGELPSDNLPIPGKLRIYWPTHKFLLLEGTSKITPYQPETLENLIIVRQRVYLDAPFDTTYVTGDEVPELSCLIENVDTLTSVTFPNWTEFAGFRQNPNIDLQTGYVNALKYDSRYSFGTYLNDKVVKDFSFYPVYGYKDRVCAISTESAELESKSSYISFLYKASDGSTKRFSANVISFEIAPFVGTDNHYILYLDKNIPDDVFEDVTFSETIEGGVSGDFGFQYTSGNTNVNIIGQPSITLEADDKIITPYEQTGPANPYIIESEIDSVSASALILKAGHGSVGLTNEILKTTRTNINESAGQPVWNFYMSNREEISPVDFLFEIDKIYFKETKYTIERAAAEHLMVEVIGIDIKQNGLSGSAILEFIKANPSAELHLFSGSNTSGEINPDDIQNIDLNDNGTIRINGLFRAYLERPIESLLSTDFQDFKVSLNYTHNFAFSGINNIIRNIQYSSESMTTDADIIASKKNIYSELIAEYNSDSQNVSSHYNDHYAGSDFQFVADFLHKQKFNYSTNKHDSFVLFTGNIISEIIDTVNDGEFCISPEELLEETLALDLRDNGSGNPITIIYPKKAYPFADRQYELIANEYTGYDLIALGVLSGFVLQYQNPPDSEIGDIEIRHKFGFKPIFQSVYTDWGDKSEGGEIDAGEYGTIQQGRMYLMDIDKIIVESGKFGLEFGNDNLDPVVETVRDIFFFMPHEKSTHREPVGVSDAVNPIYPLNFAEEAKHPVTGSLDFIDNTLMGLKQMILETEFYPNRVYTNNIEEIIDNSLYFRRSATINTGKNVTEYNPSRFIPLWNYDFRTRHDTAVVYLNRGYIKNRYVDSSIFVYHSRKRLDKQDIDFFNEIYKKDPRDIDIEPWIVWDPVTEWCSRYVNINKSYDYQSYNGDRRRWFSNTGYHNPLNPQESPQGFDKFGVGGARQMIYCLYAFKFPSNQPAAGTNLAFYLDYVGTPTAYGKLKAAPNVTWAADQANYSWKATIDPGDLDDWADIVTDDFLSDTEGEDIKFYMIQSIDHDTGLVKICAYLPFRKTGITPGPPSTNNFVIHGSATIAVDDSSFTSDNDSQGYALGRVISTTDGITYIWTNYSGRNLVRTLEYVYKNRIPLNLNLKFFNISKAGDEQPINMNLSPTYLPTPKIGELGQEFDAQLGNTFQRKSTFRLYFEAKASIVNSRKGKFFLGKHVMINHKTYRLAHFYEATSGKNHFLFLKKDYDLGGELDHFTSDPEHYIEYSPDLDGYIYNDGSQDIHFGLLDIDRIKMLDLDIKDSASYPSPQLFTLSDDDEGFKTEELGKALVSSALPNSNSISVIPGDDTLERLRNSVQYDKFRNVDDPNYDNEFALDIALAPHLIYNATDNEKFFIGKSSRMYENLVLGKMDVILGSPGSSLVEIISATGGLGASYAQFNPSWEKKGKIYIGGDNTYPNTDNMLFKIDEIDGVDPEKATVFRDEDPPLPNSSALTSGITDLTWDRLSSTFGSYCYLGKWDKTAGFVKRITLNKPNLATSSEGLPMFVLRASIMISSVWKTYYLIPKNSTTFVCIDADTIVGTSDISNIIAAANDIAGTYTLTLTDQDAGVIDLSLVQSAAFDDDTELFVFFNYNEEIEICKTPIDDILGNAGNDIVIKTKYSMSSIYKHLLIDQIDNLSQSHEAEDDSGLDYYAGGMSPWNYKQLSGLIGGMSDSYRYRDPVWEKFRLERIISYQSIQDRKTIIPVQSPINQNITATVNMTIIAELDRNIRFKEIGDTLYGSFDMDQFGAPFDGYNFEDICNFTQKPNTAKYSIHDIYRQIKVDNISFDHMFPSRYRIEYVKGEPAKVVISRGEPYWLFNYNDVHPYEEYETPLYLFKLNLDALKFNYNDLFHQSTSLPQRKLFMDFYVRGAGTKMLDTSGGWLDNTGLVMYIWDFKTSKWYSYYGFDSDGSPRPRNSSVPIYKINNTLVEQ